MANPNISNNSTSSAGGTMLGAAVGGIFNMINGGLSAAYNKKQQERALEAQVASEQRQNEYNIAAEKRALQYQKDLIDYTNEYNTPAAQAARYREAGLNPYLVDMDSGVMSQPAAVGADAVSADSGFSPASSPDFGVDKFAEGALAGAQYSLEKRKVQFEADKIELAKQQFYRSITESDREFLYKKQMDEAEMNFKKAVQDADEKYRAKQISLAVRKQLKDEAHTAFEEARETASDKLAAARDARDAAEHGLFMRIKNLEYNKSEEEYNEIWPELKRNRKIALAYDSAKKNLSPTALKALTKCEETLIELRQRVADNDISYQHYQASARKLWNEFAAENNVSHYWDYDKVMSNPYKTVGAPIEVDTAAKLFGLFK